MEQLTLNLKKRLAIKNMYIAFVNGEVAVLYYDKPKWYNLTRSNEMLENDVIEHKTPFSRYYSHLAHKTHENSITYYYDGILYKETFEKVLQ